MKVTRKRSWFPWLVVGLLCAHVAGMVVAVFVAMGDRTFVPLPDYYGRAIRWDQSQDAARQSDALGWSRKFSISPPDSTGKRTITVDVTDAARKAVSGLKAAATIYPELAQNHAEKVNFTDNGDGTYSAAYRPVSRGPIIVELEASRNLDRYVTRAQLFVGGGV